MAPDSVGVPCSRYSVALEGQVTDFVRIGGKIEGGPAFGTGAGVRMLMRALLAVDVAF